ncbi:MAG: carbon-nitrogen hydrolase family protein [Spirochaetota bacterium]
MEKIKIGLIQMHIGEKKEQNIERAIEMVEQTVNRGAQMAILPEMFNCPYQAKSFPVYAEGEGGFTWKSLSEAARNFNICLAGGSIPEKDENGNIYNTAYIFDNTGAQIAKHRKMHLFDINIEGGQKFKESDTLTAGDSVTVFETRFCTMGVAVCYDIRFPELFRLMALKKAKVIIVPGAFNMTTGPAHWELLFRLRALDNQVYMAGVAPARDKSSGYVSYAHSIVTSPWGDVVAMLDEKENSLVCELDLDYVDKIRHELPLLKHRREDVYTLTVTGQEN